MFDTRKTGEATRRLVREQNVIGGEHDWKCLCKEPQPEYQEATSTFIHTPVPIFYGLPKCRKCGKIVDEDFKPKKEV